MSRFELCKFTPAPDSELICGICMNVLDIPHETPCRHVFCRDCIWTAIRENQKCPVCRAPCREEQTREVLPLVQNLINKLTMKCDNFDNGCTDLIVKEFFLDHVKSCEYAMVQCRYKSCGEHLLKRNCEEHESKTCVYRDRVCESGCGLMIPLENANSHNCVENLVALVKDLREKNLALEKRIDELQQAPVSVAKSESSAAVGGNQRDDDSWTIHSITSDDNSSFSFFNDSTNSSMNSSALYMATDVDWSDSSDDLEYGSYRTDRRRSSRLAALNHGSESVRHSAELDQSHANEIPRSDNHDEDENADRSLENGEITDGDNSDEAAEYQVVEEIINLDESCHSQSSNSCTDGNAASLEFSSQAACESTDSPFVLDISDIDASPKTNNKCCVASTGKRQLEDDSEVCDENTARTKLKRIKQSRSQEHAVTQAEKATFTSGSLSASNSSNTELLEGAKKHPHGHKRTEPDCHSAANVTTGLSLSVDGEAAGTTVAITNSTKIPHNVHPPASSSDSTNTVNSIHAVRHDSNLSRRGPVTRSQGQDRHIALKYDAISFADLLSQYAQENDSSDESWSPSRGNCL